MFTHKIPNHLETEDLFLFGLTVRQCLLLFVGAGLSDLLFTTTFGLFPHPTTAVLILCLVVAGLCMLLVVAIAFVKIGGRGLEEWGLVLLVYQVQPRVYTWHFTTPDVFERHALLLREQISLSGEEKEVHW